MKQSEAARIPALLQARRPAVAIEEATIEGVHLLVIIGEKVDTVVRYSHSGGADMPQLSSYPEVAESAAYVDQRLAKQRASGRKNRTGEGFDWPQDWKLDKAKAAGKIWYLQPKPSTEREAVHAITTTGRIQTSLSDIPADVDRIRAFVRSRLDDSFVKDRLQRNVHGLATTFEREQFWYVLLGCLLTTRQRSTTGSPVDRFLEIDPFPLSLALCAADVQGTVESTLTRFGGIRFAPKISMQAQTNYRWLARDGWAHVEEWFNKLAELRSKPPNRQSQPLERDAARFAMGFDPNTARKRLMGLGPKQARNLWQWLGLTRYEIPLDSRVTDWINRNLTAKADGGRLSDENYYVSLLDYLQEVCDRADVLPCVFDAAAFDNSNSAAFANLAQSVNSSQLGTTTIPGYINRNRQITIRNTGLPGTDHLQYVYQVACTNCGHTYGANGSDLYDRKCPLCQAGVPGLPLALTAHA